MAVFGCGWGLGQAERNGTRLQYTSRNNAFDTRRADAYVCAMVSDDALTSAKRATTADGTDGGSLFAATLRPHRSLSPRGFALLMAVMAGVSFISGVAFAYHGAWPVMGFFGLDVALVYLAFRINYRSADASESVVLSETELVVERRRYGQVIGRWTFQPYWLRVAVEEDTPGVVLISHGRSVAIGTFLSPEESLGFAEALSVSLTALHRAPHLRA
jgi:uncharacterized membrane protein